MNQAKIRVAGIDDLQLLVQLDCAIFGSAAYSPDQWQTELHSTSATTFIAESSSEAVGFCAAARAGDDYEIRKIGVLQNYRRHGVAFQLLQSTERATGMVAGARCLIDVAVNNSGAISFYQKAGFVEFARRKRYYANGDDAILMQKFLSVL